MRELSLDWIPKWRLLKRLKQPIPCNFQNYVIKIVTYIIEFIKIYSPSNFGPHFNLYKIKGIIEQKSKFVRTKLKSLLNYMDKIFLLLIYTHIWWVLISLPHCSPCSMKEGVVISNRAHLLRTSMKTLNISTMNISVKRNLVILLIS
jgi:hypothetical protein